jgi:queuine/archaeosine tRNA-ribosyltransferase
MKGVLRALRLLSRCARIFIGNKKYSINSKYISANNNCNTAEAARAYFKDLQRRKP